MGSSKFQIYTKTSLLSVSRPLQGHSIALCVCREMWQRKTVEFQIKKQLPIFYTWLTPAIHSTCYITVLWKRKL